MAIKYCWHLIAAHRTEVARSQPPDNAVTVINMRTRHPTGFGPANQLLETDRTLVHRPRNTTVIKNYHFLQRLDGGHGRGHRHERVNQHQLTPNLLNPIGLEFVGRNMHNDGGHFGKAMYRASFNGAQIPGTGGYVVNERSMKVCRDSDARKYGREFCFCGSLVYG